MNKEKYYIPNLEDFHIGYIYDEYVAGSGNEYKEVKMDMDHLYFIGQVYSRELETGWVRSKYLDKENIESLGWNYITKTDRHLFDRPDEYSLSYGFPNTTDLVVSKYSTGTPEHILFKGECKSINELKTIMKLLNIPYEQTI